MTASTIGAGKSQAGDEERIGPDSPLFWVGCGLLLLVLVPVGFVIYLIASAVGQHRKVRPSRMAMWALAGSAAALLMVSLNPLRLLTGQLAGWLAVIHLFNGEKWIAAAAEFLALPAPSLPAVSLWSGFTQQAPLGLIVGLWLAAARVSWGTFRRLALNDLEGPQYSAVRPFGILDELRRRRSLWAIRSGRAVRRSRGGKRDTVAVGTGRYGHVVNLPVAELQRPTIVLGMIRSGKTALACSLLGQTVRGGVCAIDFKGDSGPGSVPEFWARFALANGRKFKHFTLADKNGAPYQPPAPGAPSTPAFYDPLRHGNADSKTAMLLGSVDRTGDAAAYLRSASEFVLLAYQVAQITGRLDGKASGFQAVHDLCDPDFLTEATTSRNPATGEFFFDAANAQHTSILARVQAIQAKFARDSLLRDAVQSTKSLLSSYMNGAAAGPWLRTGPTRDSDIELLDAVLEGHIVVFSLPVQDYKDLATVIGNLVLLNLNNTIASLRQLKGEGKKWDDFYLQVEEFGSARPEAILDVLNKSGDVGIRPLLSSQSWQDISADGDDTQARRILDQAGNVFTFTVNDAEGPVVLSELTQQVTRNYPRTGKEYTAGLFGIGLRSANTGEIQSNPQTERQLLPSHIQGLARQTRHDNRRSSRRRIFECIWIAAYDGKRVTHTHKAGPNEWVERIRVELCGPEQTARRFKRQVFAPTPDQPMPGWAETPQPGTKIADEVPAAAAAPDELHGGAFAPEEPHDLSDTPPPPDEPHWTPVPPPSTIPVTPSSQPTAAHQPTPQLPATPPAKTRRRPSSYSSSELFDADPFADLVAPGSELPSSAATPPRVAPGRDDSTGR